MRYSQLLPGDFYFVNRKVFLVVDVENYKNSVGDLKSHITYFYLYKGQVIDCVYEQPSPIKIGEIYRQGNLIFTS